MFMGDVVLEGESALDDANMGPYLTTNFRRNRIIERCGK